MNSTKNFQPYALNLGECFKAPKHQNFPFQQPLISYLLKNAKAELLQKFRFSCKLLFVLQKVIFCKELEISSSSTKPFFDIKKLCFSPKDIKFHHKIFVYGTLACTENTDPKALSTLISKHLHRCEAEFINIKDQELSVSELMYLVSKKTKVISMEKCTVADDTNGTRLNRPQIIKLLKDFPDTNYIESNCYCSNCYTLKTTSWRRLNNLLKICRACDLYYKLYQTSRPIRHVYK